MGSMSGSVTRLKRIIATNARCKDCHILDKFILDDLGVYLRSADISMSEHFANRFNRHSIRQSYGCGEGVSSHVEG